MTSRTNELAECHECGSRKFKSRLYRTEVYDTPWEDTPNTIYHCKVMPKFMKRDYNYDWRESCLELLDDTSWADFRYFHCPCCGRYVCEQNPRNGWHSQYRMLHDEQICLKCYEEHILAHGIDREELGDGHLPGMFFSGDNSEPLDAGYHIVPPFYDYRVGDPEPIIARALELIDSGQQVIIGYERLAIGGLEGYVTLFAK